MWAIEASPSPKVTYRGGWYHFDSRYTTRYINFYAHVGYFKRHSKLK